jgi:hypothetical protein
MNLNMMLKQIQSLMFPNIMRMMLEFTMVKIPIRSTNLLPVFLSRIPTIGEQIMTANEYVLNIEINPYLIDVT